MAANITSGYFTINPSGPGVLAGTSVTVSACTVTSNIVYSVITSVQDNAPGTFNDLTITPGSGSFTATCNKYQLPATLTVSYVCNNTA